MAFTPDQLSDYGWQEGAGLLSEDYTEGTLNQWADYGALPGYEGVDSEYEDFETFDPYSWIKTFDDGQGFHGITEAAGFHLEDPGYGYGAEQDTYADELEAARQGLITGEGLAANRAGAAGIGAEGTYRTAGAGASTVMESGIGGLGLSKDAYQQSFGEAGTLKDYEFAQYLQQRQNEALGFSGAMTQQAQEETEISDQETAAGQLYQQQLDQLELDQTAAQTQLDQSTDALDIRADEAQALRDEKLADIELGRESSLTKLGEEQEQTRVASQGGLLDMIQRGGLASVRSGYGADVEGSERGLRRAGQEYRKALKKGGSDYAEQMSEYEHQATGAATALSEENIRIQEARNVASDLHTELAAQRLEDEGTYFEDKETEETRLETARTGSKGRLLQAEEAYRSQIGGTLTGGLAEEGSGAGNIYAGAIGAQESRSDEVLDEAEATLHTNFRNLGYVQDDAGMWKLDEGEDRLSGSQQDTILKNFDTTMANAETSFNEKINNLNASYRNAVTEGREAEANEIMNAQNRLQIAHNDYKGRLEMQAQDFMLDNDKIYYGEEREAAIPKDPEDLKEEVEGLDEPGDEYAAAAQCEIAGGTWNVSDKTCYTGKDFSDLKDKLKGGGTSGTGSSQCPRNYVMRAGKCQPMYG